MGKRIWVEMLDEEGLRGELLMLQVAESVGSLSYEVFWQVTSCLVSNRVSDAA